MSLESRIARLIRPEIRSLRAYHVPDARGLVKLDAMENPYSLSPELRDEWLQVLRAVEINRYPDPGAHVLRARLREALAVPAGMQLLLGNGSDELIQILLMALAQPGVTVLAPEPTFVMYRIIATFCGMRFVGVPLAQDFQLNRGAMLRAIAEHKPVAVFLAYPNNPTGNLFVRADVTAILDAAPGVVVLDEAYNAFAGDSWMGELAQRDNLLVMRTLSKQGLAGLRLGVLAGAPEWLAEFDKVRLPYNINSLTQASAAFALAHHAVLDGQAEQIRADRESLYRALAAIPGLTVWPSRTNFILFRVDGGSARDVFDGLRTRGVLIKNLDGAGAPLKNCLRVTVGAPAENALFLEALRQLL
jgi:histidinol-phosphate aminotransferase